jgi:hypothetical protein
MDSHDRNIHRIIRDRPRRPGQSLQSPSIISPNWLKANLSRSQPADDRPGIGWRLKRRQIQNSMGCRPRTPACRSYGQAESPQGSSEYERQNHEYLILRVLPYRLSSRPRRSTIDLGRKKMVGESRAPLRFPQGAKSSARGRIHTDPRAAGNSPTPSATTRSSPPTRLWNLLACRSAIGWEGKNQTVGVPAVHAYPLLPGVPGGYSPIAPRLLFNRNPRPI